MNNNFWKVFISVIAVLLASLACAIPGFGSLLSEDFSNSDSGWGTGTDSFSSVEYQDGGLKMTVFEPFYVSWSTPSIESYENVHIEVSLKNEGTDPEALYGIICNEQGTTNAFYYVGISPDGYYAFIESSIALDDIYLKEGTSDVISSTASSMRLGLDCGSGSMTLYVNGQTIDTVSHSSYTSGVVGLFAASEDQNSGAAVTFDDFELTRLSQ